MADVSAWGSVRAFGVLLVLAASTALGVACSPPAHAPTAAMTLAAPSRQADVYATAPTPGVNTGDPVVAIAERAILDAAKLRKLTLVADQRLTELAAWYATQRLNHVTPSGEALDYAASYLGLTGPTPQLVGVSFEDDSSLARELAAKLARLPENIELRRYGRAVLSYGQQNIAVVVVTTADVELSQPVPKRIKAGETLRLVGSVVAPLTSIHASVTGPNGEVDDSPEQQAKFEITLTPSAAGVHRVELLADGPNGPDVVANFPIYVDVAEPRTYTEAATTGDSGSVTETAELMFKKLNESRAQAKLPPLVRLPVLEPIATANCEDMVDHHFFAHVSPTTGDVGDRVRKAGLEIGYVGENIALGPSANAMHVGLMGSPGHRGAILSKEFTHVGIGVAYDGDGSYFATEIFAKLPKTIDPKAAPTDALGVINAARATAKAPPVTLDAGYGAVAQLGADAYFAKLEQGRDAAAAAAKAAITEAAKKSLSPGAAYAWVPMSVSGLEDLARADVMDPATKLVGVGIAQGQRGPLPTLVVVLVVDR